MILFLTFALLLRPATEVGGEAELTHPHHTPRLAPPSAGLFVDHETSKNITSPPGAGAGPALRELLMRIMPSEAGPLIYFFPKYFRTYPEILLN